MDCLGDSNHPYGAIFLRIIKITILHWSLRIWNIFLNRFRTPLIHSPPSLVYKNIKPIATLSLFRNQTTNKPCFFDRLYSSHLSELSAAFSGVLGEWKEWGKVSQHQTCLMGVVFLYSNICHQEMHLALNCISQTPSFMAITYQRITPPHLESYPFHSSLVSRLSFSLSFSFWGYSLPRTWNT